jgi:hypothetical protein
LVNFAFSNLISAFYFKIYSPGNLPVIELDKIVSIVESLKPDTPDFLENPVRFVAWLTTDRLSKLRPCLFLLLLLFPF